MAFKLYLTKSQHYILRDLFKQVKEADSPGMLVGQFRENLGQAWADIGFLPPEKAAPLVEAGIHPESRDNG